MPGCECSSLLQIAVRVDGHGADGGLPPELDVDEVRQRRSASCCAPAVKAATPRVGTGEIFHHC